MFTVRSEARLRGFSCSSRRAHLSRPTLSVSLLLPEAAMFGRRLASSCPIPPAMYMSLHICSARQAANRLPSLVPLLDTVSAVGGAVGAGVAGAAATSVLGSSIATSMALADLELMSSSALVRCLMTQRCMLMCMTSPWMCWKRNESKLLRAFSVQRRVSPRDVGGFDSDLHCILSLVPHQFCVGGACGW